MASGEMGTAQFTASLKTVFGLVAGVSRNGAIHFMCMDWRHMGEVLEAAKGVYAVLSSATSLHREICRSTERPPRNLLPLSAGRRAYMRISSVFRAIGRGLGIMGP